MKYSEERKKEHLAVVRQLLVVMPDISASEMTRVLEREKGYKFDRKYTNTLMRKVQGARAERINRQTINHYLGKFEDEVEELKKNLWLIIKTNNTSDKDKVAAIKELRNSTVALFDKMFDAGVFERNLGKIKNEDGLSQEDKDIIANALNYAKERSNKSKDSREKNTKN